jgi:hypothetical protein
MGVYYLYLYLCFFSLLVWCENPTETHRLSKKNQSVLCRMDADPSGKGLAAFLLPIGALLWWDDGRFPHDPNTLGEGNIGNDHYHMLA